jgi:hypothetical protein
MTTRRALQPPPVEPLTQLRGVDPHLARVQENVERATSEARSLPQRKGRKITVELPASGEIKVPHGLGRKPEGLEQQSARGAAPSYFEVSRDSRFITLESAVAATVDFWVY